MSGNDTRDTVFTILSKLNHDLRTPLTAMLNMIGLLREDPQRHCTPETLQMISEAGEELKALVKDITDLARLEGGGLPLKPQPLALRETLQEAAAQFTAEARAKRLELRLEINGAVPERLVADKERLRQIVSHLIANALQHTPAGAVTVRVSRGEPDAEGRGRVLFAVQDSGSGIPEPLQPKIFDLFLHPEGDGLARTQGRGLGLTLSKRLVERMGGRLRVQSAPGQGSTFSFDLPLDEPARPAGPSATAPADLASLGPLHVLVVEDNFINQLSFSQMLERNGFQIQSASNGQQALDLLHNQPFDVVLMDVKMPVMDGLEATRRIRSSADPRVSATKVIALTAYAMPEDRARILAAGMDDMVSKPIDVEELAGVLQKVLKGGAAP